MNVEPASMIHVLLTAIPPALELALPNMTLSKPFMCALIVKALLDLLGLHPNRLSPFKMHAVQRGTC
jgi:hypothetical protein